MHKIGVIGSAVVGQTLAQGFKQHGYDVVQADAAIELFLALFSKPGLAKILAALPKKHFVAKHDISYLNLADGQGSSVGHWGVTGFPETFFIDRKGRAVDHVALEIKADEIEAGIRKALS